MASRSLGELTLNMVINTGSFEEGANRAERSIWKVNAELAKQQKEAERLSSKIDPVTKQLNELAKAQENISRSKELGFIKPETFEKLTEQINNTRASLKTLQFNDQVDELNKLVNKLDPAIAKYAELDAMQRQLQNGKSIGVLSGDDFDKYTRQIEQMRSEYDKVYTSAGQFAEQQNKQQIELQNILRTLDPVTAKLAELDAQQQKLSEGRTTGLIDEQQYNVAIAKLNDMREAIDGTAESRAKDEAASQKQNAELQNILRTLDPVTAKLAELDMQQQKLAEGRAAGLIDEQQYTSSSAKIDEMRNSVNGTTAAIEKQHAELGRLMQRLDPITHQIKELENAQELLQSSLKGGLINQGEYEKLNRELQRSKQALQDLTNGSTASERSTKQLKFALQGLPAQFTDIITSLQGGQNPITVLIQQGGQLKDMFGGLGPAAGALGSYIISLITPLTAAAAAVAVLGLAYYQGSQEADAFRNALILTGNASGTTVDQLTEMARRIDDVSGTQSQASAALAEIVNSGKFTAAQFESVAQTAVLMENATGKAISETVKEFESLAKDPVKAVAELNEKYNAFTGSVYEQITALVAQGEQQEAATLAVTAYSSELDSRAGQIVENLGYIERGWKAIKDGSKSAWNELLNIGRTSTLSDEIEKFKTELENIKPEADLTGMTLSYDLFPAARKKQSDLINKEIADYELAKAALEDIAAEQAYGIELDEKSIKAQQENAKIVEKTLSNEQKRNKEIETYKKNLEDIRARQPTSALLDPEKVAKDLAAIEAKYKDTNKKITQDAATQYLMRLKEQEAALRGQLESSMKLSSSAKELLQFEEKIANITGKEKLTNAEKSFLLLQNQTREQLRLNVVLEEENRLNQQKLRLQNLQSQLDSSFSAEQQNNQDLLAAFGMGDKESNRIQEMRQITRENEANQRRLLEEFNGGQKSQDEYESGIQAYKDDLARRISEQESFYQAIDAMESDWSAGASSALRAYMEEAQNTYQTIADAMTNILGTATSSLSDGLFDVATGAASVGDSIKGMAHEMSGAVLKALSDIAAEWLVLQALELAGITTTTAAKVTGATTGAAAEIAAIGTVKAASSAALGATVVEQTAAAATVATVWSPAAIWASIGSFGQAAVIGGAAILAVKALGGFQSGGYTGDMGVGDVAGVVHGKEFVFDAAATSRIGVDNLEKMRRGISGYTDGFASMSDVKDGVPAMRGASAAEIGSVNRNDISISVPVVIHGDPDEKTLKLIQKATMDGAAMAYRKISGDLATGRGDVSKAVQGGWSVSRRKK